LKKFEINDYFINDTEDQGSNCIDPGAKFEKKTEILKDKGLIAKHQNFRGKLKNDPVHPKTTSFQKQFMLSFLWSRGDRSKKPSRWPLLNSISHQTQTKCYTRVPATKPISQFSVPCPHNSPLTRR